MHNFYRSKLLILDTASSVYDIYIVGASPILGKVHLIAKNAASFKSKRKIQLKQGNLLSAVIFHKNRYYLSDFSVSASYFANLKSLNHVKTLTKFLKIIEGFYVYPDFDEFNMIQELLDNTFITYKYSIPMASVLLLTLFRILPTGLKCNLCKQTKMHGYITEAGWICSNCYNQQKFSSALNLDFTTEQKSLKSLDIVINTMLQ